MVFLIKKCLVAFSTQEQQALYRVERGIKAELEEEDDSLTATYRSVTSDNTEQQRSVSHCGFFPGTVGRMVSV